MSIQLTRFEIKSFLYETGEDIIFIEIFFSTSLIRETILPMSIPYEKLNNFIKAVDSKAHHYLLKIRQTIGGYGPKHSQIFEIIESEGFDLKFYVQGFLESLDETVIKQHLDWCKMSEKNKRQLKDKIESLESLITPSFIENNKNKNLYLEELDQAIHEVNLKYFPAIVEGNTVFIKKYKSLLINTTLLFYEQIDKLIHHTNEN